MADTKKWMPFFVSAYLADTTHLSTLEHGAYVLILFQLWQTRRPIKDSDDAFERVTKTTPEQWSKMRDVVLDFLTLTANGWVQKRLLIEVERADKAYKKRVKTINNLNSKRKDLARSTRGKRNDKRSDDRHIIYSDDRDGDRPTSTLSKERVEGNTAPPSNSSAASGSDRVPSDPSARPATTIPTAEPEFVTVQIASGAKLKIDRSGNCDEVWAPMDCPPTSMTRAAYLELRRQALTGSLPEPIARVA